GGDPRGRVVSAPADPDRVVEPTVLVWAPGRRGRDTRRSRGVVLERESQGRRSVARLVGTDAARSRVPRVRPAARGRCAGGNARGGVVTAPGDPDGMVEPAVRVRRSSRGGGDAGRGGRVELERQRRRRRVPGLIGTRPARDGVARVWAVVAQGRGA